MGGVGRGRGGARKWPERELVSHLQMVENLGMVPDRQKQNCHRCGRPKTEPACLATLSWAQGIINSRIDNAKAARLASGNDRDVVQPGSVRRKRRSVVHPRVKARPKDKARRSVEGKGAADAS